jgi:hypothetical protein
MQPLGGETDIVCCQGHAWSRSVARLAKKGCRKLINMLSETDQTDSGFVAAQTEIDGS